MPVIDPKGAFGTTNCRQTVEAAVARLEESKKGEIKDYKAKVFYQPTLEVLSDFCRQDERFAEAVLQNEGSFCDCLSAVSKGVGSAVSDLDVYRKAVQYYLPDAQITMQMSIYLGAEEKQSPAPEAPKKRGYMILNFLDF